MTGFAGSRSLDERRRRRLATDAETVAFEAATEPAQRRLTPPKVKRRRRGPAHFPLRKVISIRYWKLAAVIFLATLAGAGALAGGWAAATHGEQLGPGFVLFFRLDAARLVRGFAAVGLLLAGQLALLISWVRSQSLQDFNGRYRGWVVCAILAFLGTMALETQLTAAWSATATWLWPAPFSHKSILLWLVPTALCGAYVHAYLVREMRDCRLSLTFLWLAFLLGGGTAAIMLARPLPLPPLEARLVECGVAMLFVICVFSSLLFHARHVVYVCVDPPSIRPSRFLALLRWFRPWAIFKFTRANSKKTRKSADGSTVASLKRRTPKRVSPLRRKPTPAESQSPEDVDATVNPPERSQAAERPRTNPSGAGVTRTAQPDLSNRGVAAQSAAISKKSLPAITQTKTAADEEIDRSGGKTKGGSFEGLSRRDRRLLKKQMRADGTALRRSA
jgi:hypothetical protein